MTDILKFRADVAAMIRDEIPVLRESKTHGGRFDLAELQRWSTRAPSARTAILGVSELSYNGAQVAAQLQVGVYLVANGANRDSEALCLVNQLLQLIPGEDWDNADAHAPRSETIRADNLFRRELDAHNIALWAVTWRQSVDLDLPSLVTMDDFKRLVATYDVGGATDDRTSDRIELP